jgi:hypothetical protein
MRIIDESLAYDLTQREVSAGDYLIIYMDMRRVDYRVNAVSSLDLNTTRLLTVTPLREDGTEISGTKTAEINLTPGHPLRGFVLPKSEYRNVTEDLTVHPEEQERLMLQALIWYLRRKTEYGYRDRFKVCVHFLQERGLLRNDFDTDPAKNYRKAQVTLRNAMNNRPDVFIHSGGYIRLNQTAGGRQVQLQGATKTTPHVILWSKVTAAFALLEQSGIFGADTSIDWDN